MTVGSLEDPQGLSVSPGGLVTWSPQVGDVGDHLVRVVAADPQGLSVEQVWTVTIVL